MALSYLINGPWIPLTTAVASTIPFVASSLIHHVRIWVHHTFSFIMSSKSISAKRNWASILVILLVKARFSSGPEDELCLTRPLHSLQSPTVHTRHLEYQSPVVILLFSCHIFHCVPVWRLYQSAAWHCHAM